MMIPSIGRGLRHAARLLLAALPIAAVSLPADADQSIPVPTVVIYPGDIIRDGMLTERQMPDGYAAQAAMVSDRAAVAGKTSRRTLLPNVPIPRNAVGEPKLVSVNSMVRVTFVEGGLVISTYASALQSGASGDVIPVRNLESGLTISGTIQGDGSVRVGNG